MFKAMINAIWYAGMDKNEMLLEAARAGDLSTVEQQIASGADIEFEDIPGRNRDKSRPLHYAAKFGHEEVVRFLLDHGAQINVPNHFNHWTPLHLAVRGKHLNVVKILIKSGAYIDPRDWNETTPLNFAGSDENEAMVKFLIDSGADIKKVVKSFDKGAFGSNGSPATRFINKIKTKYQIKELSMPETITILSEIHNTTESDHWFSFSPRPQFSAEAMKKLLSPDEVEKSLQIFITENKLEKFVRFIDPYCGWKYIRSLENALLLSNNITKLVLDDCNIGDEGIIILGRLIKINNIITSLELQKNNITDSGLIAFSRSLKENKTLASINLHYNDILDDGAIALAEAIQTHPKLLYINLRSNPLHEAGCLALMLAMKARGLKNSVVNLYDQSMNNTFSADLYSGIVDPQIFINRIINKIQRNYRDTKETAELTSALLNAVTQTKDWWQDLSLAGNHLKETGAAILAQIFRTIKLINLELYYQQGIPKQTLTDSLELNTTLSCLCLENNQIDDNGVLALSKIIADGHKLVSLNLGSNWITDVGIRCLVTALEKNNNLKSLNVYSNYISDRDVIKELAVVWSKNGELNNERAGRIHSVDISCNYISENSKNEFYGILTQYKFFKSSGEWHNRSSKIKDNLSVTKEDWLVFLAYNPKSNHAMIFIEGLEENGQLFLEMFHFGGKSSSKSTFASSASPFGMVDEVVWPREREGGNMESFNKLENYCYDHWQPGLDAVKRLRKTLKEQANSRKSRPYHLLGKFGADNCLTWAIKQLKTIDIEVTIPTIPVPSLFIGYQQSDVFTDEYLESQYEKKIIGHSQKIYASDVADFKAKLGLGHQVELRPSITWG